MPRAEHKRMPKAESGWLYNDTGAIVIGGEQWLAWLGTHTSFYYTSPIGTFTARRELRSGSWYWYAYRRRSGRLHRVYVGRSHELDAQRLMTVAQRLADMAV